MCAAAGFAAGAVILKILKVLGILLLILLGILLILLLLILFCPVCYEAAGRAEKPDYQVRGKIRLFLGILTLRAQADAKGFRYSLKLFGLRVKRGGRKRESAEKPEQGPELSGAVPPRSEGKPPEEEASPHRSETAKTGNSSPEWKEKSRRSPERKEPPPDASKKGPSAKKEPPDASEKGSSAKKEPPPDTSEKSSPVKRIRGLLTAVQRVWNGLHDPTNRRMLDLVKRQAFRILRHIRPRKLRLRGVIGTGDPAQTGWILGVFYMLYPLYSSAGEFELAGDFEKRVLQGQFYLAGHVVPAVPLSAGIRLILDRDIRHFVREKFF